MNRAITQYPSGSTIKKHYYLAGLNMAFVTEIPVLHRVSDWFLASSTACNCWLLSGHGTNLITGNTPTLRYCFYDW